MDIDQQKRTYELARRLVLTIRTSQAPHSWTRRSVIIARNAMSEYMPITEDELNTSLLTSNYGKRRIQTRQTAGVTYLRAQPRLDDP